MKKALALGAVLLLSGCNSDSSSPYGPVWTVLKGSVASTFTSQKVTRQQAADISYASMGWTLDGGNESIIILATDSGGELLWTSAARIVLVTRDGRIVRTVGLGHDVGAVTPRGALPSPAAALQGPFSATRLADYPDQGHYGVAISCRSRAVARQPVTILGRTIATTRVDEDCQAQSLRWLFTDSYWVDPADGMVWRTRQHVHPRLGVLETEIFRPPG